MTREPEVGGVLNVATRTAHPAGAGPQEKPANQERRSK